MRPRTGAPPQKRERKNKVVKKYSKPTFYPKVDILVTGTVVIIHPDPVISYLIFTGPVLTIGPI